MLLPLNIGRMCNRISGSRSGWYTTPSCVQPELAIPMMGPSRYACYFSCGRDVGAGHAVPQRGTVSARQPARGVLMGLPA